MAANLFQTFATITKVTTMRDNSFRLQVDTDRELTPDAAAGLMSLYGKAGAFGFSLSEIKAEDVKVPDYAKIEKNDKSPSTRQRNVLFLLYKQQRVKSHPTFDDYYRFKMEEIINHFKKNLDN